MSSSDFRYHLEAVEVVQEGGAQLRQLRKPLGAPRRPWHISLITAQLKTLQSQAGFCFVGAVEEVYQFVFGFFSLLLFSLFFFPP